MAMFYEAVRFFVTTLAELLVLFVLISMLVIWLQHKLPRARVQALLSGGSGYFSAAAMGAITPFCSCSTLPMMVGLLRSKAAFGPVMTFLFTSPLLNPVLMVLLWSLFSLPLMLLYMSMVLLVAVSSGLLLQYFGFERFVVLPQEAVGSVATSQVKGAPSLVGLFKQAVRETRSFLPYLLLGVLAGSLIHGYVPASLLASVSSNGQWWLIPLAAAGGILLYIRASTMLPLAASLVAKGVSLGPVMALTIGGAGASLPEMIMLKRIFHWPLMLAFILVVLGMACVTGFGIQFLLEGQS
ncbi:permease [Lacimicrobium alkaliphilum]|uniref:Permease n=1 Tax=Lacimicrobium alkaliphilum TaxID=1526571 RepID=A0A0U2JI35_9ALTE|nr:permease [Lacimicrobium alkaliphilum]ALS96822.1 permease [Lacimicrobium alkaliphilum]